MTFSSTLRGFSPYVKLAPGDAGPGLQGPSPRLTLTSLPGKDFITQGWLYSPCSLRTHATVFFWGSSAQEQRFQSVSGNQDLEVIFTDMPPKRLTDDLVIHRIKGNLV